MRNKIISLSAFLMMCFLMMGQSNIRLNNYWENIYSINPGSIDNHYQALFSLADRKQWVRFPGAPNTMYASATTYIRNMNTQLGVNIFEDKIGYTSSTNVGFSYAYAVELDAEWRLNLGLAGSLQSLSYDMEKLITVDNDDPKIYKTLTKSNNINSDMGLEFVSQWLKIGAASQNTFSLFSKEKRRMYPFTNFMYAMYRRHTRDYLNFGFGINGIQNVNLYQMELNVTSYFKKNDEDDLFQIGAFYRTGSDLGAILGLNIGDFMHLSYSCDFNVGNLHRGSAGTHELMIIYKLKRINDCRCY